MAVRVLESRAEESEGAAKAAASVFEWHGCGLVGWVLVVCELTGCYARLKWSLIVMESMSRAK